MTRRQPRCPAFLVVNDPGSQNMVVNYPESESKSADSAALSR